VVAGITASKVLSVIGKQSPLWVSKPLADTLDAVLFFTPNSFRFHPTQCLPPERVVGIFLSRSFHAHSYQSLATSKATRRDAMDEVIDWLNFYHKRLHSTLGYVSPMTFEQRWTAAQQQDRKCA
jgi:hypothetical protein